MSTDGGDQVDPAGGAPAQPGEPAARRAYNRPRRYPVQAPELGMAAAPAPEVTRQNPSFADAAEQYGRTAEGAGAIGAEPAGGSYSAGPVPTGVPGAPPAGASAAGPSTTGRRAAPPSAYPHDQGPGGYPPPAPQEGTPGRSRTPSTRTLVLIGAAVVVLAVVVGLIVGLSGGDDPVRPEGAGPATATAPTATASTTTASTAGGAPPAATEVCSTLGSTAPISDFVAQPRPGERLPTTYVEPRSGVKVAVCVGLFRPGGGAGRGRIAYLAEYEGLPATEYALTLKTRGWVLVPTLPRATYRDSLGTTVTLVQQGTSLVTVVGTGR